MRRGKTYDWIPLWRNKWLMGSTRWELDPGERSVFIDFLCLAGADDGFIRANPVTPYPLEYLAASLQAPLELVKRTVEKCIAVGKIVSLEDGILYVASWQDYRLEPRRKRELMEDPSPAPRTEHQSPNLESREEGREEHLHLDETKPSAGKAAQIRRVLGGIEESGLDRAIERERHKAAISLARAAAGQKGMRARWEKYNKMADNKTDNKITNDSEADSTAGDPDEEGADEQAELDARLEARKREERDL